MDEDNNGSGGTSVRRRPRLSTGKKVLFASITCLVAFGCLEVVLAVIGVKPLNAARDPSLGLQTGVPLFVRDGDAYVTNEPKLTYFNAQRFPVEKSDKAYRIFCLGGSTTFGRPYDDRTSYVGWLRELLGDSQPDRQWEVVNCGGVSYASYRLAVIMEELANYQPDMIVVYTGHNEFLEERTFRAVRRRSRLWNQLFFAASHLRVATLVDRVVVGKSEQAAPDRRFSDEVNTILDHSQGPESYTRDPALRQNVAEQFQESLNAICDLAGRAGAKVIFIKPASNLRSFSPFKSEHGSLDAAAEKQIERLLQLGNAALDAGDPLQAAEQFASATQLDPEFAWSQYLAGQACLELERFDAAAAHLLRAKDEDICPLRATSEIQQVMEKVAADHAVPLIDLPGYLQRMTRLRLGHDVVGDEAFLDHVHPSIDLHLGIARLLMGELTRLNVAAEVADMDQLQTRISQRVLAGLNDADHGLALCNLAQVLSWAGKNVEALKLAELAAQKVPNSSYVVSQYGRLLEKNGDAEGAFVQFRTAVSLDPNDAQALSRFGGALLNKKAFDDALVVLQMAAAKTPERAPKSFRIALHAKLGDCLSALGRTDDAARNYAEAKSLQQP